MARLYGIFGKASGKKGDGVFSVKNGQQQIRQYNPIVADPSSEKQVAARAKMKLMSQLSRVLAPIMAIPKVGAKSTRNQFVSINYGLVSLSQGVASINLNRVQLTKSSLGMVNFNLDRSNGSEIICALDESAANSFDAVVYAAVTVAEDGRISPFDSVMVSSAGADGLFAGSLPYTSASIEVWAYGIKFKDATTATTISNITGDAASHIASLVTTRNTRFAGSQLTQTIGVMMVEGDNTADSDDVERAQVTVNVVGSGTVSGAGSYPVGTQVTLIASPASGASFIGYYVNGSQVSSSQSYSFELNADTTVEARFTVAPVTLSLSVSPSGSGTVTGAGSYQGGTSVTAVATPTSGYYFVGWYDGATIVSNSASYSFTINSDTALVAHFEQVVQYQVSVSSADQSMGSVSGGGSFDAGSTVTVRATPNQGYTFVGWTENGNVVSTNASYTFELQGDRTLVATFKAGDDGGED